MKRVRFKINYDKCVQGMHFLAWKHPGITQYYLGKSFFFADREHLLDWGRPISGDKYVAMKNGPVPSKIYNIVKRDAEIPNEVAQEFAERMSFSTSSNKIALRSRSDSPEFPALSETDREYLDDAVKKCCVMGFSDLMELSHDDKAYEDAWSKDGQANEMNPFFWLSELGEPEAVLKNLTESSVVEPNHF